MQNTEQLSGERSRVVLVDDHPLFCAGLRAMFAGDPEIELLGEAGDADLALLMVQELRPEIAFVDMHLPSANGSALTADLRARFPTCRVIGLSAVEEPLQIAEMFRAGAVGFVLKTQPISALREAIRCTRVGIRYVPPLIPRAYLEQLLATSPPLERLTRREREVLGGLIEGESSAQIALQLAISVRTVETHRQRIMNKLDVHSILELANLAARCGVRRRS